MFKKELKSDNERLSIINKLLTDRVDYLQDLINEIRDYLVECDLDKSNVDICYLLKRLD